MEKVHGRIQWIFAAAAVLVLSLSGCASQPDRHAREAGQQWHGCSTLEPRGGYTVKHMQDSKRGTYYAERWYCRDRLASLR